MNPVTAIRLAFGAIFIGGYLVFQLGLFGQISQVTRTLSGEQAVFESGSISEAKGLPGKVGWVGEKMNGMLNLGTRSAAQEVKALMNPDLYNADRTLTFQMIVSLDDVLRDGETAPPQELEQIMVEARAGDLVMRECADVYIGDLFRGCALIGANTERVYVSAHGETFHKPSQDIHTAPMWRIEAELAFLPAILPGNTSDKAGWAIEALRGHGHQQTALTVENTAQARATARADLLQAAKLTCEKIRDTYGTCVLYNLAIKDDVKTQPGHKDEPDTYIAEVAVRPSLYWLRAPTIPEDNTAIEMAMATNPALPVLGKYFPPQARSPKLGIEHNARKERAEERSRREAEKLERARQQALSDVNDDQDQTSPSEPILNNGTARNGTSRTFSGGALNSGGVVFKSVD